MRGVRLFARAGTVVWAGLLSACAARRTADAPHVATPAAATCFDLRALNAEDQRYAERLLLDFGDREGLYTLGGGLKPISSDVGDLQIRVAPSVDTVALGALDRQRRIAAQLTCGPVGVLVQVFTATQRRRDSSEVRNSSLVVYHRDALRDVIVRHREFFAALGVTPSTAPHDVLAAVENAPRAPRWRGYGYLFGYPDVAVDFFVTAGVEGDRTGTLVPRDFRRIETVYQFPAADGERLSTFVYAVPKGAVETDAERVLRERAARILERYRALRVKHVRADSTGAAALWREWISAPAGSRAR